jgi:quercetin dioxygenase-like cupin family protein
MPIDKMCEAFVRIPDQSKKYSILGMPVHVLIRGNESEAGCFSFEQVIPVGLGVPPHLHTREDEICYILRGDFEVYLMGETFRVGPGSVLNFVRGAMHGFKNVGKTVGSTLWTVTPGSSFEEFFEVLSQFPSGPPDVSKLDALHEKYGMVMPSPS